MTQKIQLDTSIATQVYMCYCVHVRCASAASGTARFVACTTVIDGYYQDNFGCPIPSGFSSIIWEIIHSLGEHMSRKRQSKPSEEFRILEDAASSVQQAMRTVSNPNMEERKDRKEQEQTQDVSAFDAKSAHTCDDGATCDCSRQLQEQLQQQGYAFHGALEGLSKSRCGQMLWWPGRRGRR